MNESDGLKMNDSKCDEASEPVTTSNSKDTFNEAQNDPSSFKVPSIIGLKPKTISCNVSQQSTPITETEDPKPQIPRKIKEIPSFPYKEPSWGGKPIRPYCFEVLKTGKILSDIELSNQSYTVFGRLDGCNIVLEHPSVSRYHAVLQYRIEEDEKEKMGFYIFDLGSTHGTFLNKQQLKPRTYYRMHVGHMLKLGGSSRMFILKGPSEDEEPESDLTVTEIKQQAVKKQIEALKEKMDISKKDNEEIDEKNEGIDWGFGDDASDEAPPLGENPFAHLLENGTTNEELYLDDPKKTLRGWFEREGYELEYKVEEKGVAHFACRVELPLDVAHCTTAFAEATVKGKKKEAVVACALEACRILDRHGILRQSQQEGRKRKQKNWEDEDFYDSDDDTFLDRTGAVEKKREMRKKLVKKDEIETYATLLEKFNNIEKEIAEIQNKLQKRTDDSSAQQKLMDDQDSLDAYMAVINTTSDVDKKMKSKLKLELSSLIQNRARLQKLVNIARPTTLPPLSLDNSPDKNKFKKQFGLIIKGHSSLKNQHIQKPQPTNLDSMIINSTSNEDEFVEEVEIEDEEKVEEKVENKNESSLSDQNDELNESPKIRDILTKSPKRIKGPEKPPLIISPQLISPNSVNTTKPTRKRNENADKNKKFKSGEYDSSNPDYAMWLPPDGQTGDGKTYLNDKFGY